MKLTNTIELLRAAADTIEGKRPSSTEAFLRWRDGAPPRSTSLSEEDKELVASLRNEADMLENDEYNSDEAVEARRARMARARGMGR